MVTRFGTWLALGALCCWMPACGGPVCARNSDCQAGYFCSAGACDQMCRPETVDVDCEPGQSCSSFGQCVGEAVDGGDIDGGAPIDTGAADAGVDAPMTCVSDGGTDADGDGFCEDVGDELDCDDEVDAVHPGAEETCTSSTAGDPPRDENCDGRIDESCAWHFGRPHWLPTAKAGSAGNVTLSIDGLRLYFRGGPTTMSVVSRTSLEAPFGVAVAVSGSGAAGTIGSSSGGTMSEDELELIYNAGGELLVARRATITAAFGAGVALAALNDAVAQDWAPSLSPGGLELFYASSRGTAGRYEVYRSMRSALASDDWSAPELVSFDWGAGPVPAGEQSPALSADGLTLFFGVEGAGGVQMYMASRESIDAVAFDAPVRVADLAADVGDDFYYYVSDATREIFFASTRGWGPAGGRAMWRAEICRDGPCPAREVDCPGGRLSDDRLHCYWRDATAVPWVTSRTVCGTDAHAATIQSLEENTLIAALYGGGQTWLGGYDGMPAVTPALPAVPQCTVAIPGCAFGWTTVEPWTYANFAAGEPNNSGGNEDGLLMTASGTWNDGIFSFATGTFCERELWPTW